MVTKKVEPTEDPWEDKGPLSKEFLTLSVPNQDALTVTLKAGSGYDAPWLVFHTSSVGDAIMALSDPGLDELIDLTARKGKELAKAFNGLPGVAKAPASSGGGWSKPKASASSSDRPEDTCPQHNCDLEFVGEFTNPRTQKTTSARMACPVPKCYKKTYWLNDDGTWSLKEQ